MEALSLQCTYVHTSILTSSPLNKLFHNIEMVVSCSIMQCSRTIFVLCTDFSRVFPQQLQFLLNKVQPSISGCLLNNKIVIFRNNCFSLTARVHAQNVRLRFLFIGSLPALYILIFISTLPTQHTIFISLTWVNLQWTASIIAQVIATLIAFIQHF